MFTADTWPITCKMAWGPVALDGTPIGEAGPQAWAHQLKQVRCQGFDDIDPTDDWVPFWEFDDTALRSFTAEVAKAGLRFGSLSMGRRSVVDVVDGERNLAIGHRFIELAAEWGVSVVNIGFMQAVTQEQKQALWFWHAQGHVDDPALRPLAIERVRELADHAQRAGVRLSLEIYEDTYCGTADDAVAFLREVDHPVVGINPDVGNLIRLHRPVPTYQELYATLLPYANFWHIKNYLRDEDPATGAIFSAPAPLETGLINYRSIIEQALVAGFDGVFMAEHYGGDWLGVQARNARYIRDVLRSLL